jgi:hypothetical protein
VSGGRANISPIKSKLNSDGKSVLGSEAAEEERLPKKFFFQSRFGG